MEPPRIGILGSGMTREAQRVCEELRRRGAQVVMARLDGFPLVRRAVMSLDSLSANGCDLFATPVWLVRQLGVQFSLDAELSPAATEHLRDNIEHVLVADREVRSFLASLLWSLSEDSPTPVRVVNHPTAASLHQCKPLLAAKLRGLGVPVPQSLTTTDRRSAEQWIAKWGGQAICKAAAGGGEARLASTVLDELQPGNALVGPLLFQQRIVGRSLRAYVVGGRVVSCCEVLHGDAVDWRADQHGVEPWSVSCELSSHLCRCCAGLGLDYAGIDLELDCEGTPFVIDVNPAPLFASYERHSGHDVAGPLAELLIDRAGTV